MAADRDMNTVLGRDISGRILNEIGRQTSNEQFPRAQVPGLGGLTSSGELERLQEELGELSTDSECSLDGVDGGSFKNNRNNIRVFTNGNAQRIYKRI